MLKHPGSQTHTSLTFDTSNNDSSLEKISSAQLMNRHKANYLISSSAIEYQIYNVQYDMY